MKYILSDFYQVNKEIHLLNYVKRVSTFKENPNR